MLGMMNCPTDNVEFYSASPSSRRSYLSSAASANTTNSSSSAEDQQTQLLHDEEDIRVFSEAKDRPHISYTEDGRKMVDGKLMESEEVLKADPMKMWDRLILSKVAETQLQTIDKPQQLKNRRKSSDKSSDRPIANSIIGNPKIQPATPIRVNSANPNAACSTISLPGDVSSLK